MFNGELFVYTEWKVTSGVVRRPICDGRVQEYTVTSSVHFGTRLQYTFNSLPQNFQPIQDFWYLLYS